MNSALSIDLVICTYNNASLLQRTLESVAQLTVPAHIRWGVLVVNNNCSDDTASTVEDHISKGVLPIRTVVETTQGLTTARVCGVKNTEQDWIAFIDDDCILAKNWIEEAENFLKNSAKK